METNIEQLLKNFAEQMKGFASTQTILGDEFELGGFKCRPVISLGLGYGGGNGEGEDQSHHKGKGKGVGAAGGIGISPIGFLTAKGDEISFVPSSNKKGLASVLEKVPDLMEKFMEMKEKKEAREAKANSEKK